VPTRGMRSCKEASKWGAAAGRRDSRRQEEDPLESPNVGEMEKFKSLKIRERIARMRLWKMDRDGGSWKGGKGFTLARLGHRPIEWRSVHHNLGETQKAGGIVNMIRILTTKKWDFATYRGNP